jgi:putative ABC transport system permease protein
MSLWRQLTRGLRALFHRDAADRDIADEVDHYLQEATAELVARGFSPEEARRAARLEIGSTTSLRERVRSYGWENVVGRTLADLRYGTRRLRRNPGFAVITALTLALGIGASTSMFSAAKPILFERLPYPDPDRIATIWDRSRDDSLLEVTFGTYRELVERSRAFETLTVMRAWQPTITGSEEPERIEGQRVSAGYFRVLAVRPALGRDFDAADDRPDGPRIAILSNTLWQRRFNANPSIIGASVMLDDERYTVIGVMPRGFENVLSPSADIWAPLQYGTPLPSFTGREWGHHLRMAGRLRDGIGVKEARSEIDEIARSTTGEFPRPPWAALGQGLIVARLQDDITAAVKPALIAVLGAVALLVGIACVNVANLLLGRGAQRRGEFAMRTALGATRSRLLQQLLTESVLLALIGGALGVIFATAGVRALVALSPPNLPRVDAIVLDRAVLLFAFAITMLIGVGVGLIPGLHASRGDLDGGVRQGSRHTSGHQLIRRSLVVAEVALALVLLVGAGLLLRSLHRFFAISPGFDTSHLLTMQVQTAGRRFDKTATHQFFMQALEAVRRVPGVTAAAFTSQLPLSDDYNEYGVLFESSPDAGSPGFRYAVSPGYLEAMRIPLLQGRTLDARDIAGSPPAVLISESFAKRFGGNSPIGQRVHVGPTTGPWYTIVGVVGDVKQASLAISRTDAVYIPDAQWVFTDNPVSFVVRSQADAARLAPAIRAAIWSVDKNQPIVRVATMDDLLAASAGERRFALIMFEAFGLVALLLTAVGIYGVISAGVTERTREIGVRAALGASRGSIVTMVLRQGLVLTALGIGIGLAGAIAGSRMIVTLLFGITALDVVTYVGVAVLLFAVSAIACGLPAWRAAWVDPSITLRAE